MKKNTLKTLGIMVLSITMLASAVTGCGSRETGEAPATEIVEAAVETETEEPETETEEPETETEEPETETEEETGEVLPEETETEEPEFVVTDMSATKYAKQSVNVRKGPSSDYEKLGGLSTNQKVTVTGQADSGWYRIEYNGAEGYVSDKYLSDQKVTASASGTNTNTAANAGSTGNASGDNNSGNSNSGSTGAPSSNNDSNGGTGNTNMPSGDNGSNGTTPTEPTPAPGTPEAPTPSTPEDDPNCFGNYGGPDTATGTVGNDESIIEWE